MLGARMRARMRARDGGSGGLRAKPWWTIGCSRCNLGTFGSSSDIAWLRYSSQVRESLTSHFPGVAFHPFTGLGNSVSRDGKRSRMSNIVETVHTLGQRLRYKIVLKLSQCIGSLGTNCQSIGRSQAAVLYLYSETILQPSRHP